MHPAPSPVSAPARRCPRARESGFHRLPVATATPSIERVLAWQNCTMQEDEESQEFDGRPSKSARKREASAAQNLGTRLIALKESDLRALALPETLHDAIMLAKRITSRGGLARQRQYI